MYRSKFTGIFEKRSLCCTYEVVPEQKARTTYENLLLQADDPDVIDVLRYLRQREIVHYQRFAEGIEMMKEQLDEKNFYAFNPVLPFENNCTSCGCQKKKCNCN